MILTSSGAPKGGGFTLIEVLIALLVTSVGLLGLAKMQTLAISATKNTGTRSLIALQVESLGSLMHANRTYWATVPGPASFTATASAVIDATHALDGGTAGSCTTSCTPAQLAAADTQSWVEDMNAQFPTYAAKVDCTTALPINCSIYVTWSEKVAAMNQSTATGAANQISTQSFSVYIKP